MSTVEVSSAGIDLPSWSRRCRIFVAKVLAAASAGDRDVSIVLCDNEFIRGLNRAYRGKDEATDVLSFPLHDGAAAPHDPPGLDAAAGDVVVSIEAAAENAEEFGVGKEEEIKRLLIHGVLHLLGWDHGDNSPDQEMLQFQEKILAELTGERLL